jgi:hypothetical protein
MPIFWVNSLPFFLSACKADEGLGKNGWCDVPDPQSATFARLYRKSDAANFVGNLRKNGNVISRRKWQQNESKCALIAVRAASKEK